MPTGQQPDRTPLASASDRTDPTNQGNRGTDLGSEMVTVTGHGDGWSADREAPDGGASSGIRRPYPGATPVGAARPTGTAERESGPGVPFLERVRRRKRDPQQRENRAYPRFNDTEWTAITAAAKANDCMPGTYTALATLLAAGHDDPRAAVADFRAGIQRLDEATTALDQIGNLLNQWTRYLHQGGTLTEAHARLLERIDEAVDRVETTAVCLVRD
ncbi:hypothetical protein [Streptacidiphilus rugosus]|uniref:hypothetical protein n=1 Tax=Streptacidiphilus rugosus TaxID=405783 RepID=UPI0012FA58A3|nr:hypothetical protein [Streptacidiphilus rugosus]